MATELSHFNLCRILKISVILRYIVPFCDKRHLLNNHLVIASAALGEMLHRVAFDVLFVFLRRAGSLSSKVSLAHGDDSVVALTSSTHA